MNLLLLEEHDFTTNARAEVRGARLEHIRTILGAKVGDTLTAGQLHGKIGTATITSLTDSCATLQTRLTREPPLPLPLTMVLALPRPKALRRILRNVAELGIKELYLVNAYKVEKSYWDSPLLQGHPHLPDRGAVASEGYRAAAGVPEETLSPLCGR